MSASKSKSKEETDNLNSLGLDNLGACVIQYSVPLMFV